MKIYLSCLLMMFILLSCKNDKVQDSEKELSSAEEDVSIYQAKGDAIVMRTFDTLRNTLLAAISEKGFDGAVEFCNTSALPLTNTYAQQNITIKRTSNKLRNPANAPDSLEQRILARWLHDADIANKPLAVVEKDDEGNVHYFKPIIMQPMCLNCHGNNEQVEHKTLQMIRSKYPGDAAVGYQEGDVRGLWHVVFRNEE